MTNRRFFFSRIYQGVFHEAILQKTKTNQYRRKKNHREHGEGTEMLLPAKGMTICVSGTHIPPALYTSGLSRKTNGEGGLFWKK